MAAPGRNPCHIPTRPSARSGTPALAPRSGAAASRKKDWCAASTIVPRSRWGLRERSIAWSWRRIPKGAKKSPIGVTRKGVVYELFFTDLPQQAFPPVMCARLYGALVARLNRP
jgi:hypothetical protein